MSDLFISVDVQTSGPIPGDYSLLSLGMSVCGYDLDPDKNFYIEIRPLSGSKHDQSYLESARFDWKKINEDGWGFDPKEAMSQSLKWVRRVSGPDKPVLVSWNGFYDHMFITWYFTHFLGTNPFGTGQGRSIDLKSLLIGRTGIEYGDVSERSLAKIGITNTYKHTGNALEEAKLQGDFFQKLSEYNKLRVQSLTRT